MKFVLLLGLVSLFADMTYEGARGIAGQYLGMLGANAIIVSTVSGFGEFIGYAGRIFFGILTDKTRKYWPIMLIGYACNVLTVPLLALTTHWSTAAFLLIAERFGKAIRTPSRDAILSYATKEMGRGWGFGIHEAMDRIGAVCGPLIVTATLYLSWSYPQSFAILAIPALLAMAVLFIAQRLYPRPQDLEVKVPSLKTEGLPKSFWIYVAAVSCVGAGYADFPLIAYHFKKEHLVPEILIPITYALAMVVAAVSAITSGRLYDLKGIPVLKVAIALAAFASPFLFLGHGWMSYLGIILWGIGLGVQGSTMRAVVGHLVPAEKRATAYGILNASFGFFWFLGSAIIGILYESSTPALVLFSVAIQLLAIAFLKFGKF